MIQGILQALSWVLKCIISETENSTSIVIGIVLFMVQIILHALSERENSTSFTVGAQSYYF